MPEVYRQLQPRDGPVPPIWGADAETASLDVIVFSKDRACQLDALLRSVREFLGIPHRIHVLYNTSSQEFERGYDLLRNWHPGVNWVCDEGMFRQTMNQLMVDIDHGTGKYLMFLVDDMMFTRTFTAGKLMESMDEDEDILAVSLRMGEKITYCYVRNINTTPPDFSNGYRWAWKGASSGYWNYPMSQDAHIFRISDFAKLLPRLKFVNPNTLEATQSGQPFPRPDMVCEATPSVINIAANRVQSIFRNRCGNISAEFLNESFLAGLAIDVETFTDREYNSCHIDEDLPLIEDQRTRTAPGIKKIKRDGRDYFRIDLREINTFILNCKDDNEKRLLMEEQLTELDLNFEFIRTLEVKPGWVGVALGHLKALRLSRARPPFLVLEDDCVFNEHFKPVIEVPATAEALYLGASVFGIEKPGEFSWGKVNKVVWEHFDEDYLRVHNMLARHALLYLDENFQAAVIESQVEALTNRAQAHMGDIGLAMLQHKHITLLTNPNMCRQINRNSTNINIVDDLPGNELNPVANDELKPVRPAPRSSAKTKKSRGIFLVSHKYRFAYFPMSKNASSTLKFEFRKPRYACEQFRISSFSDLDLEDYFKFAFLRDPVSRFVSAYQEISFRGENNDSTVVKKPFMELEDNPERFQAFIQEVEKGKWDPHVISQGDLVDRIHMDFYGRVESLESDLQSVFRKLGIENCPPLPKRRSRTGRSTDYGYNRYNFDHEQLPQTQLDQIRKLYLDDVDLIQAYCPAPTMLTGELVLRRSNQSLALELESEGSLSPLEIFTRVNASRKKCIVYTLGDRGFCAEFSTVARAMIYAWAHDYQLLLDSGNSSWVHEKGWSDYFEPFCQEPCQDNAHLVVENFEFLLDRNKSNFHRLRGFMPQELSFGQTHLKGFQEILGFFVSMIFQPTPDCQAAIDVLTASLKLPADYDAIHVRRGDKVGDEDVYYPVKEYLDALGPLATGRTLLVMSDSYTAVQETKDYLDRFGSYVRVVSLVQPERTGFDVRKLQRGESFIGHETGKLDENKRQVYVKDNTRELIAEIQIAAGARYFVSTWLSNVGRTVWYLHPSKADCVLLRAGPDEKINRSALIQDITPRYHWADTELRNEILQRRQQYCLANDAFKHTVVYSLSGLNFLEEASGLARAMIYAFSHQYRLQLDPDSLGSKGGIHWHDKVQPLVPEAKQVKPSKIKERLTLADDDSYRKLSACKPDQLNFGSKTLDGFYQILGFFLQMLVWPSMARQDRIAQLLDCLPLNDDYDALCFDLAGKGRKPDKPTASLMDCLEQLQPLPNDRSLCIVSGDDEVFTRAGKHLAATGRKVRAVHVRRGVNDNQAEQVSHTLAELALVLGARRFVFASGSPLGHVAWLMHPRQDWCRLVEPGHDKQGIPNDTAYCLQIQLRGGDLWELEIPADSEHLPVLQDLEAGHSNGSIHPNTKLVQLPLDSGKSALTFSAQDVEQIKLDSCFIPDPCLYLSPLVRSPARKIKPGHNEAMNLDEGHLGGYVASRHPHAVKQGWIHGDPMTYTPELWRWLREHLDINSVLDLGCGEGHAAKCFQDLGCRVLGIDGSVQAQRDSVIPDCHLRHDYVDGPYIPDGSWDMVWCCEFVEHVEERFSHHFLATISCARKYVFMTYASPGQPGWHHVNCQPREYWIEKMERLGFRLDEDLARRVKRITSPGHFRGKGLVFVRADDKRLPPPNHPPEQGRLVSQHSGNSPGKLQSLPLNDMLVTEINGHAFFLFLDIFIHPERDRIVAVLPWYSEDWDTDEFGIDFENVELVYRGKRFRGTFIPHRLDSWEPCALLDFAHPQLEKWLRKQKSISFSIKAGPHEKRFKLSTQPPPAYNVLMSLVIKDENRWLRHFLEYYLECLQVDHILVYDNFTRQRDELLSILQPYLDAGKVTYISWDYRWRNLNPPRKMIAQPQQESHSLNRFANSSWIGFLDVDEFLRLPGKTLPEFLDPYKTANVDGLSFGLRWFQYEGTLEFEDVVDVPLTFQHSYRSKLGRKRQKLFVSPHQSRFLRLHTLEEGGRELQVDDTDIYFHHYCQRAYRFKHKKGKILQHDDYMLQFADKLTLDDNHETQICQPASSKE